MKKSVSGGKEGLKRVIRTETFKTDCILAFMYGERARAFSSVLPLLRGICFVMCFQNHL